MRKEIALLLKKKIISDVTQVALTKDISKGMPPKSVVHLREMTRQADVFHFFYKSDGLRVAGYMALPKRMSGKMPCIIYNRGGSFDFFKLTPRFALGRLAQYASWGYVVVASQYRGNDGGEGQDELGGAEINDVLRLRTVLRAIPHADVTRIGMVGGSRGGMMTYLALSKARWIKAAVTIAGLADAERNVKSRPGMDQIAKAAHSATPADFEVRSAVRWPQKFSRRVPILLMHGTGDWRVTPLDSMDLSRKLYEAKVPHRLIIFEGGDHSLSEFRVAVAFQTRAWLDRFVKDREPLPNLKPHGE